MAEPLQQIPLDLGARRAVGRQDFQIGSSNIAAVSLIDRWPEWPAPLLIISGPPASGKSHLAAVWAEKSNAEMIRPEMLLSRTAEQIAEAGKHLVLDGLDPWLGDKQAETTLFHLYNIFWSEKRNILATMRMTPMQTPFVVADLASRVCSSLTAQIQPPDDMLLASVLIKLFTDRQLSVTNDVIQYVLPRMERSFAAAHDIVDRADRLALSQKRGVSVPLMRHVMAEIQEDN
jgi:chromosomal replication initiation ATPase DnaA